MGQARWRTPIFGRTLPYASEGDWASTWEYGAFTLRADPASNGKTTFSLLSTYYDSDHAVKKSNWALEKGGAVYQMTNADFGAKYHHFAVSYDPSTHQIRAYVDYVKMLEKTLPGDLAFDRSETWKFGADFNSNAFDGWYDEIRLTRKILEPSEFLVQRRPLSGAAVVIR